MDQGRRSRATPTRSINLGVLFAKRLVPPQLDEARTWYTKAAEAGAHQRPIQPRGACWPQLSTRQSWTRPAPGTPRRPKPADTSAQASLGVLLATTGELPELDEARIWWTKAAQAGHTSAQYNLGVLLATTADPPELDEARTWWTRAAEAGNADARDAIKKFGARILRLN